jgi:hypothetical protein
MALPLLETQTFPMLVCHQQQRVIPATTAAGELHVISLGWGPLDVRGRGPRTSRLKAYRATARAVTAFDNPDGTGVRTGW